MKYSPSPPSFASLLSSQEVLFKSKSEVESLPHLEEDQLNGEGSFSYFLPSSLITSSFIRQSLLKSMTYSSPFKSKKNECFSFRFSSSFVLHIFFEFHSFSTGKKYFVKYKSIKGVREEKELIRSRKNL